MEEFMKPILIASLLSSTFAYSQNLDDINQQLQIFLSQQQETNNTLLQQMTAYEKKVNQLEEINKNLEQENIRLKERIAFLESNAPTFYSSPVVHLQQANTLILENIKLSKPPIVLNGDYGANQFIVKESFTRMKYDGKNTILYVNVHGGSIGGLARFVILGHLDIQN